MYTSWNTLVAGVALNVSLLGPALAQVPDSELLGSDQRGVIADADVITNDQPIDIEAVLAGATFSGVGDNIEMTVHLPLPAWAEQLGALGRVVNYKGICGPEGAVATREALLAHARRDLERMNAPGELRGSSQVVYGTSPSFRVTFDTQDVTLVTLFLPSFAEAAEYVDGQLDNRSEIRIDLSTADLTGNVIGTAGSSAMVLRWSTYVQALRLADNRVPEDTAFAGLLPTASIPVRYNASAITEQDGFVVVNDTQLRAIFGDNVLPQDTAITIQLDNTSDWDYFVFSDSQVNSGDLSLVDVAVHEITHGLGYRSQIREAGNNPNELLAGLDVARFRFPLNLNPPPGTPGSYPLTPAQFTSFPRHGGGPLVFDPNYYVRPNGPGVALIEVESGDFGNGGFQQPSHLAFRPDFSDKLGLMDPVLSSGETWGPTYWNSNELLPLTDMGWKIVNATDVIGDCNGNGVIDLIDILNGARDADGDSRLDACEFFAQSTSPSGLFVNTLTQTVYAAGGITSLTQFVPANAQVLARAINDSLNLNFGPSASGTVQEFSGKLRAPAPDEYIFRVEHENDAVLEIAGQSFFLPGRGTLQYANSNSVVSLPVPIQLEAGYHQFKLQVLLTESGPIRLVREARNLGGWQDIPSTDMAGTFFVDCNGNGFDDLFELDTDGDGIIDDCEIDDCDNDGIADEDELDCDNNGVPDDCEPRGNLANAFDVGVAGLDGQQITIGTCDSPSGFQFDTEVAVWDASGTLLEVNDDDFACNTIRLSRIITDLPAGDYVVGIGGFNVVFDDGFVTEFPSENCSDSGSFVLKIGSQTVIDLVASGKVKFYRFAIESPSCPADYDGNGMVNILDVVAFINNWNAQGPGADFNNDGSINILDVVAFITTWNLGCP